ncbi:class II Aldolase and Adducin N-terminal domain protein [Neorickettsia helminthoeca str. Oregon]|uniref:Class II Aldolase and Adducin N-terminal domain protein n=1 Tax=Neorickettsia helminthoeca str. Oregon TaxID=1286528 RepID=X5H572_9RICK|nr:class II aldolase/adducin family protein [Neorickettsia helminthoeca]AHX11731.1 class II Aldolase and Adducin N-terminal domain protein [Neorickettsia helminthoeca str. Oregon]
MQELQLKQELLHAYLIIAYMRMDDLTYTHITARPKNADFFYILRFGKLFARATIQDLIKVSLDGEILEGKEHTYNKTAYIIHGSIYKTRKDVNAIYHLHTHASIAVSVMKCGLLPLSQFAMPFFENIAYHEYTSLLLNASSQGESLAKDLGSKKAMLMRSHGLLTCGNNLKEAFFYIRFLEQACKIQVDILSTKQEYIVPKPEICRKAREDMLGFEESLGGRDWNALLEVLQEEIF